ncbi:MAG: hypothetical protein SCARUB_01358 [Candidatus Scalindua rubra]|uniref:Uncharacterized protein n=1 Tax=Candidatus Scalindua rubra TaxID=1872076 RepID=A0A1E3XF13_9BACT|nr:MAG: hypothetical protein SCARUB_01358 [Candidatus Scalindua rubra]
MKNQIEKLKKENENLRKEILRLDKRIELVSNQSVLNKNSIKDLEKSKGDFHLVTVMNRTMIRVLVELLEKYDVVDEEGFRQLCKEKYLQFVNEIEWKAIKTYEDLSRALGWDD